MQSQRTPHSLRWRRVSHRLTLLPSWLAATALFILMAMTISDVVLRSAFNNPIEAATELTRIFMAIIVFSSLPIVAARRGQIVVDLLDGLFSARAGRVRDGAIDIICGGLLFWPTQRVFVLAERARNFGDVTEYLHLPQFYMAYFIMIMTALTGIVMIARGSLGLLGIRVDEPATGA